MSQSTTQPESRHWKAFLAKPIPAECRDHMVQFYESEGFLAEAVSHYIGAGIMQGDAIIIIARAAHIESFSNGLAAGGHDVEAALASGQLVFLNADDMLAKFMDAAVPDPARFRSVIGGLIESTLQRFKAIRAYGEMVDILRAEGNHKGMIALEEQWNELGKSFSFALLCGYGIQGFANEASAAVFEQVCHSHTHVLPTEKVASIADQDGLNRRIAILERRAAALQAEIVERKRMEVALREAVRAREEFLSIASHELRTPITSLKLQAQVFQRRFEREDPSLMDIGQLSKFIETTFRQVGRLDRLVEDMLDISRISQGKLQMNLDQTDLGEVVRDVVDRFSAQLKAQGCRLRLTIDSSVVGEWDRYRLDQVVTNLITNAMKYAPGKPLEISVTADGRQAILKVRDQGPGISGANLERIFQRFERGVSASNISGLGLGLYISRQIVDAHRGSIRAESRPGEGASFVVELPLA